MIRLDRAAIHIAVDMQCLFAEPAEWFVPWLPKVLPNVLRIAERHPDRTIFTRFIPPSDPDHAVGAWRDYYERWRSMARDRIDLHLLELVEPLRKLVPPAKVLNKTGYSAFGHPRLVHALRRQGYPDPDRHRRRDRCLCAGHGDRRGRSRLSRGAAAGRAVQRQRCDPRRADDALSRALQPTDRDDVDGAGARRLGLTAGTAPRAARCRDMSHPRRR